MNGSVVADEVTEVRTRLAANEKALAQVLRRLDAIPDWLRVGEPDRFARPAHRTRAQRAERLRTRARELVHNETVLQSWLDDLDSGFISGFPAHSRYGVLLPLRLETRFVRPTPGAAAGTRPAKWKLRVRVEPDAIALATPPAPATRREAGLVERFWTQARGTLDTKAGGQAFERLSRHVGPARAAWLIRTVGVDRERHGTFAAVREHPASAPPPRPLVGLPRRLEIWGGPAGSPRRLATLSPDRRRIAAQANLDFVKPRRDGTLPPAWWTSYRAAVSVGLATEIVLGEERPSLDVLLCVGLGGPEMDPSPLELFTAHVDAGRLGTIAPLTPTNTVQGEPAADLRGDPAAWLEMVRLPKTTAGGLGAVLTGVELLTGVLEPDLSRQRASSALVTALWPVLWQRSLKDLAGLGDQSFRLGSYAGRNLHPLGPYPTLRIGDLPYGVLPIADFDRMEAVGDPLSGLERAVLRGVQHLTPALVAAAGSRPPVADGDEEAVLAALGQVPTSREYGSRHYPATQLLAMLMAAFGGAAATETLEAWERQAALLREVLPVTPARRHSPTGFVERWPQQVSPDWAHPFRAFLDSTWRQLTEADDLAPVWRAADGLPLHPLARLVRQALLLTLVESGRLGNDNFPPDRFPFLVGLGSPVELGREALRADAGGRVRDVPPAVAARVAAGVIRSPRRDATVHQFEDVRNAVEELAATDAATVQSVLTGVLDAAGHRVDVWYTAIAHRRLRQIQALHATPVLGAYGWVDDLAPKEPDPSPTGLVHAPGHPQAVTAALLRDHAVRDPQERWSMTLDSASVRAAADLADQVRSGLHLSEVLGREIEREFPRPDRVLQLRRAYPARPEWAGRRVCDGQQVLDDVRVILDGGPRPERLPTWLDPDRVQHLFTALDAYADLLVADALHTVVEGRGDAAADALEAAAGLAAPPELRMLRTRREGATLRTDVWFALPWRAAWETAAVTAASSPVALADPALARWLAQELGAPRAMHWFDPARPARKVTLAALGLRLADTLLYPPEALNALARDRLGGPDRLAGTALEVLPHAARLADLLGAATPSGPEAAEVLRRRLRRLRTMATALARDLRRRPPAGPSGEARRRELAARARRFGLATALWDDQETLVEARQELGRRRELGTDDAKAPAEELARRIRQLLPTAAALPLVCPEELPDLHRHRTVMTDWLPVMAAVRPRMADLDAAVLLGDAGWPAATTDERDDPWAPPPPTRHGVATDGHRTVVVGPGLPVRPAGGRPRRAAVARLDSWGETLPARRHTSWTAFGYDAPRARAPQAVLVAVPADTQVFLDLAQVRGAVLKARQLARARSVTGETPAALATMLPLGVVETGGQGTPATLTGESP